MHHLVLNLSILNHIVTCHYFTIFMQKINKNLAGPTSEECSHCVQCCGSVSRSRFLTLKLQFWFCFRLEPWPGPLLWPRHDLDLDLELDNIASLLTLAFMRIHLTFHKFLLVLNQRKVLIQKETKILKMYRKQAEP